MAISTLYAVILAALLIVMFLRLLRSFRLYKIRKNYTAAISAPSVSVCIPARNEAHAMAGCLERVLASDYHKLEVIVFDDNSTDETPLLIHSFAQAGVRFVPGTELPEGWLGRNCALETLAREASGTFVIFMDVDTFIKPSTISQLVGYHLTEDVEMVSVIPQRIDVWRASVLLGHLRYFWELILARSTAPASSGSLWMIKRQTLLERFGGFEQFKATVDPESILARQLGVHDYHCLISDTALGATYEKKWRSQMDTSLRLLYPMTRGMARGFIACICLVLLNIPSLGVLSGLLFGWSSLLAASFLLLVGFMAVYALYARRMWIGTSWWLGGLLWPIVVSQELILFIFSTWVYARRTLMWKGRRVAEVTQQPHSSADNT